MGDEITHTLRLAAQGKLVTRRRPVARKQSVMDSPRKHLSSHHNETIHENSCISRIENNCTCGTGTTYWPSQESRDIDSNYGCGDTTSVSECHDSFNDSDLYPR